MWTKPPVGWSILTGNPTPFANLSRSHKFLPMLTLTQKSGSANGQTDDQPEEADRYEDKKKRLGNCSGLVRWKKT